MVLAATRIIIDGWLLGPSLVDNLHVVHSIWIWFGLACAINDSTADKFFYYFFLSVIFNARHTIQQDSSAALLLFAKCLSKVIWRLVLGWWEWAPWTDKWNVLNLRWLFCWRRLSISKLACHGYVQFIWRFVLESFDRAICLRVAQLIFRKNLLFWFSSFCVWLKYYACIMYIC